MRQYLYMFLCTEAQREKMDGAIGPVPVKAGVRLPVDEPGAATPEAIPILAERLGAEIAMILERDAARR